MAYDSTTKNMPGELRSNDRVGIGALIREAEATPEGRAELAEGQRWVYEMFYRDGSRPMLWAAYSDHLMGWMVYRQMPTCATAHEETGPFKSRADAECVLSQLLAQLEAPNVGGNRPETAEQE